MDKIATNGSLDNILSWALAAVAALLCGGGAIMVWILTKRYLRNAPKPPSNS